MKPLYPTRNVLNISQRRTANGRRSLLRRTHEPRLARLGDVLAQAKDFRGGGYISPGEKLCGFGGNLKRRPRPMIFTSQFFSQPGSMEIFL